MGCDYHPLHYDAGGYEFQSTHPHGVRPPRAFWLESTIVVSIHAPTWGATDLSDKEVKEQEVSIHAPTWGATSSNPPSHTGEACFNPRTHMGCDTIRAARSVPTSCFNPRTHMWCDKNRRHDQKLGTCFNPRTHMWCDKNRRHDQKLGTCFNPRTHMGCDLPEYPQNNYIIVSIHAPTWGATRPFVRSTPRFGFQSTHPHGVRR